jgi:DnaA family protein
LSSAFEEISKYRSIIIGDKELNYLLTYTERSISSLTNILNKLDELSIQQKRKITIPLIKEII